MDTVEYVRTALASKTWTQMVAIAAETGVPPHTIRRIATGLTTDPRHNTLEPLRRYVESMGHGSENANGCQE